MSFVHLVNHTEFSMLQSSIRIRSMIKAAQADGQTALAITDHGNMFGVLEFYFEAKKAGIKPILGVEIYLDLENETKPQGPYHPQVDRMVLIAENQQGYYNLMKIVTYGYLENFNQIPLITRGMIEAHKEGLIALYGGMHSIVAMNSQRSVNEGKERIGQFLKIFEKENFYLQLQNHLRPEEENLNRELFQLASEFDLEVVATNSNHYLKREDSEAHAILNCIAKAQKIKEYQNVDFPTSEYYFKSQAEMTRLFDGYPQAIENTQLIAQRCEVIIRDDVGDAYWPKFEIPASFEDSDQYLSHMTWERLPKRYASIDQELRDRVQFELDVMKSMKVSGYMLIVQDFINWARDNDIPVGPGRGSAVGSVVSYIVGITDVEPMQFGLLFERFLNPERVSMPDIDTDFSDKDREKVIQYVTEKYGRECVSQIVTYSSMKAKAVLRDVARVLDIHYSEVDPIAKIIPLIGYDLSRSWDEFEDLRNIIESRESYKKLWKFAITLEGLKRQPGIHAAAVIIAPKPLVELAPLYQAPGETNVVIQYDKTYAENVGFLKMDFLGLRNLSVIKDALQMIWESREQKVDIQNVNLSDAVTYDLLGKGHTVGVFQFESPGMQEYLRKLKPSCLEDMIAMNALYRPGPIENIPRFIDCKHGLIPIDCYHDDFKPFLGETYGVIVYQEQVMLLAQKLAGFSLGGADNLRRIMAKKKPEALEKIKPEFFGGAEKNGYPKKLVERLWEVLIPFCNYAFNKSHSAAYAFIGYQTAYLKANFGPEFMAANMSSEINDTSRLVILLEDCKNLKIGILPPDINQSKTYFSVFQGKINYGLAGIKGVGTQVIDYLIEERQNNGPYLSLFDLCKRMAMYSSFNKRTIESLIMAGALDRFEGSRADMFASVDLAVEYANRAHREKEMGQLNFFDNDNDNGFSMIPDLLQVQPWSHIDLLAKEKEVMGLYITGHPLEEYRMELQGFTDSNLDPDMLAKLPLSENSWKPDKNAKTVVLGGVILNLRQAMNTKTNRAYAFGFLEDFKGKIEVTFWSDCFESYRDRISNDCMVIIEGYLKKRKDSDTIQLEAVSVMPLEESRQKWTRFLHVRIESIGLTEELIHELDMILSTYENPVENGVSVLFHVNSRSGFVHTLRLENYKVTSELDLIHELQDLLGVDSVKIGKKWS
jgi:DNA polymerase III subunit alpha